MDTTFRIVDRFYELLAAGDVERLAMLYAPDGEIVRYDGVSATTEDIEAYYRDYLADRPGLALRQIDQMRHADDVLMWDALVDSDIGVLQTLDVVILDDNGLIRRHVPGFRGFWGD